jgi:cob(I)alamin adenosyltransferase
MKKSLVYTKTGDKGMTSLIGGTRVPKQSERLEAYGTVDELNCHIGMIWSYPIEESLKAVLYGVQNQLFYVGAYLATDDSVSDLKTRLKSDPHKIELLELEMDRMESDLPPLSNFVLPGGHPAVSACHIARTVCRRAERRVLAASQTYLVDEWVIMYLNRLSDYLFVLSRYLTNYFKIDEIPWKPEL